VDVRVVRIIKCLRLLQADGYSATDLAGHFRVSKRTVYRDLRLLAVAGVPIVRRTADRRYCIPDREPA
jgi:predicted DNA-binding transcriptional regulator YafY